MKEQEQEQEQEQDQNQTILGSWGGELIPSNSSTVPESKTVPVIDKSAAVSLIPKNHTTFPSLEDL